MTRILLIPVAGTLAALALIAFARQERGQDTSDAESMRLPFDLPGDLGHEATPEEDAPEPPPPVVMPEEPVATPEEFDLRLEVDGSFVETATGTTYAASLAELVKKLGDPRHTLVLTNADGVAKTALDEAEARLRDRYTVRKVYRAAEAPPGEDR